MDTRNSGPNGYTLTEYVKYQFPARLIQNFLTKDEQLTKEGLERVRKRILLEVQLNEDQTIEINSTTYTKNDILDLFATIEKTNNLNFHLAIEQSPWLQNVLSASGSKDLMQSSIEMPFDSEVEKNEFLEFVSPYLAFAINRISIALVKEKKYTPFLYLLQLKSILRGEDFQFAFKKLLNHYQEFVHYAEITKGWKIRTRDLRFFRDPDYFRAANLLGEDIPNLADDVGRAVVDISYKFKRPVPRYSLMYQGLMSAIKIIDDPELRVNANHNIEYFASRLGYRKGASVATWRIVILSIVIFAIATAILSRKTDDVRSKLGQAYAEKRMSYFKLMDYGTFLKDSTQRPQLDFRLTAQIHKFVSDSSERVPGIKSHSQRTFPDNFKISEGKLNTIQFTNNTSHGALFVLRGKTRIASVYIEPDANSSIEFWKHSEVLIYTGQAWNFYSPSIYRYSTPSASVPDTTGVYMNGSFRETDVRDEQLLTKKYQLSPKITHYSLQENLDSLWLSNKLE